MIFSAVPLNSTAYASQDTDVQPIETAAGFFQYVYDHELDEDGETPVSYTHLDVYKRQLWEDRSIMSV